MRALLVATVLMGVLIVAGLATIAVTIVHRMGAVPAEAPPASLDEPAGSAIVSMSAMTDGRIAALLHGGGLPDRVVAIDPRTGRVRTLFTLAR